MDKYYGVLSGAAFSISYSVSGLFAGQLSDNFNRKVLIGVSCMLFSLTTLVQGQTSNFLIFFIMRFLLGILQSISNPTSFTLLADYFPQEKRTTVNSIQNSGIYIGSALSSFSILAIKTQGWRWTFNAMGYFGIILGAIILIFVKEPPREKVEKSKDSTFVQFKQSLTEIWKNPTSRYVTLAGIFNYIGGFAMMYYMPSFFQRVYPMYKAEFASLNALSLSVLGFISALVGGLISDRFSKKNILIKSQVCYIGSLLALPVSLLTFATTGNFWLSISCLALKYLFGESWMSPAMTMI